MASELQKLYQHQRRQHDHAGAVRALCRDLGTDYDSIERTLVKAEQEEKRQDKKPINHDKPIAKKPRKVKIGWTA